MYYRQLRNYPYPSDLVRFFWRSFLVKGIVLLANYGPGGVLLLSSCLCLAVYAEAVFAPASFVVSPVFFVGGR